MPMHDEALFRFGQADIDRLETETFLQAVELHESIGSTSDRALALCRQVELVTPHLVLAHHQSAGRGRGANRWWSAGGALTFSLIVEGTRWNLPSERLPQLSLITALALRDALAAREPHAQFQLKWPNDLYASPAGLPPRKLAGILLERPSGADQRVVIGIGINVNNSHADAPEDVRQRATSLCDLAGRRHPLADVLVEVLLELEGLLMLMAAGQMNLPEAWQQHCLLCGREIEAISGPRRITGRCEGIDPQGALLVRHGAAVERLVSATIESFR